MQDKRNYRRFSFENNIFLKFENDPGKIIEGKLLDIGFVGLSIFLTENAQAQMTLQAIVQFDIPGSPEQHLIGKGKVAYVNKHRLYAQDGFRLGLEFVEVDKEMVINILNRLESKILEQTRKRNRMPGRYF